MPRGARLDAPGTLHHVMVRGIEQQDIFIDDQDRDNFVSRLAALVKATETPVYAWALMSNHVHILLKSGPEGLPMVMRRLLTGYAVTYNKRHNRHGHLFENRYKSIVCEEEAYFKELVRYIHLNPLRAGAMKSLSELNRYKWCGHSYLLGQRKNDWQDTEYVHTWFSYSTVLARRAYLSFIKQGMDQGRRPELVGGGLIRSLGGWSAVKSMRRRRPLEKSDQRILGSGQFVEKILDQAEKRMKYQIQPDEIQEKTRQLIQSTCNKMGIQLSALQSGSRVRAVASARRILAIRLVSDLGLSLADTARQLGVTSSAIAQILRRKN